MPRSPTKVQYDVIAKRTDEILHYVWDPIGVVRYPQARDEYASYVPQLVKMLIEGKKMEEIAAHLSGIEKERMGLSVTFRTKARATNVAQILIEHHEGLAKKG